jgi:hypothetical protein
MKANQPKHHKAHPQTSKDDHLPHAKYATNIPFNSPNNPPKLIIPKTNYKYIFLLRH